MKNNKVFIIIAILAVAYLGYTFFIKSNNPNSGEEAPTFEAEMIIGQSLSLDDFKGKYVILDFWASWCPPCRVELPKLIELQNANTESKFEIISIALEKDASNAALVAEKLGLNWSSQIVQEAPLVATNKLARLYGVTDIPASFLIDPNGQLLGQMNAEQIRAYLAKESIL